MEVRNYRITGVVQGVGFRPFVHKLANDFNIKGWILNDSEGVLMEIEGKKEALDEFLNNLHTNAPPLSKINNITRMTCKKNPGFYKQFSIKQSINQGTTKTLISADTFVCDDCVKELFSKNDRRYHYPFINCTNCGPRYSIITDIPYDRKNTTMHEFIMCKDCLSEYNNINNRRYHAQPNACPVCGPKLILTDNLGKIVETDNIINFCINELLNGKIFGVKSIGGYHLVVNALDEKAVKELRRRKKRDSKPFALMVNDVEIAEKYAYISDNEKELLQSVERPIVILKKRESSLPASIAPKNPNLGIMLPSAPLHYLLLKSKMLPVLVMTSGNISGQPIAYKNNDAVADLSKVVDYYLHNNRDIHIRIDDSIVKCIEHEDLNKKITTHIRRSRGYSPFPIKLHKDIKSILATGSELKNTVCISKKNEVFVSQHIGDLKNDKVFNSHLDCCGHLQKLFSVEPDIIAFDMHPGFRTKKYLESNSCKKLIKVQHHHAHMASCMAENNIESNVIGVIFDGTGYGLDGAIWGGEFLVGDYSSFIRAGKIRSFNLIGGDKAIAEPFRVAIDLLINSYGSDFMDLDLEILKIISKEELKVYHKMSVKKINTFTTSSMGRLFDGISSLLNICNTIEYEAQAAIELESILNKNNSLADHFAYEIIQNDNTYEIDIRPMVREIISSLLNKNITIELLSRKFHSTIIGMIVDMSSILREKYRINDVVLSGGVFMNEFILGNSIVYLKKNKFNVYYHSIVPCNDGGICLGQAMIADANN